MNAREFLDRATAADLLDLAADADAELLDPGSMPVLAEMTRDEVHDFQRALVRLADARTKS